MKFNFKIQQYHTDAVESVVSVFKGQPYQDPVNYRRDIGDNKAIKQGYSQISLFSNDDGNETNLSLTDEFDDAGFKNERVLLSPQALLSNIKDVQQNNNPRLFTAQP